MINLVGKLMTVELERFMNIVYYFDPAFQFTCDVSETRVSPLDITRHFIKA